MSPLLPHHPSTTNKIYHYCSPCKILFPSSTFSLLCSIFPMITFVSPRTLSKNPTFFRPIEPDMLGVLSRFLCPCPCLSHMEEEGDLSRVGKTAAAWAGESLLLLPEGVEDPGGVYGWSRAGWYSESDLTSFCLALEGVTGAAA